MILESAPARAWFALSLIEHSESPSELLQQ
jgi:hypothetical protein